MQGKEISSSGFQPTKNLQGHISEDSNQQKKVCTKNSESISNYLKKKIPTFQKILRNSSNIS